MSDEDAQASEVSTSFDVSAVRTSLGQGELFAVRRESGGTVPVQPMSRQDAEVTAAMLGEGHEAALVEGEQAEWLAALHRAVPSLATDPRALSSLTILDREDG